MKTKRDKERKGRKEGRGGWKEDNENEDNCCWTCFRRVKGIKDEPFPEIPHTEIILRRNCGRPGIGKQRPA